MIPFNIQGVILNEPTYDNNYVKFLIKFQNNIDNDNTTIPVSIFKNKFNVEYKPNQMYKIEGGFDSIPVYKRGFFLVYNAKKISILQE